MHFFEITVRFQKTAFKLSIRAIAGQAGWSNCQCCWPRTKVFSFSADFGHEHETAIIFVERPFSEGSLLAPTHEQRLPPQQGGNGLFHRHHHCCMLEFILWVQRLLYVHKFVSENYSDPERQNKNLIKKGSGDENSDVEKSDVDNEMCKSRTWR